MQTIKKYHTDVLVIGGGLAGLLAAREARKQGATVILVDKGHAGKSGQSPYADSLCPFNPDWGHDMETWLEVVAQEGEYVNNPDWTKLVFENSFALYQQFIQWGVTFLTNDDGSLFTKTIGGKGGPTTLFFSKNQVPSFARKEALSLGVQILDRTMVTNLIKENERVVGAACLSVEEAAFTLIQAKATIMCAGAVGFKPNGWPIHELTGDADALAYRIGADVLGKEYIDTHLSNSKNPGYFPFADQMAVGARPNTGDNFGKPMNAEGNPPRFDRKGLWLSAEFEVHQGRGPVRALFKDGHTETFTGGTSLGMACHKTEGIVAREDLSCTTHVDGLFAAGDALGNMAAGACYPVMGFAIMHAGVTGRIAGTNAAKYAQHTDSCIIRDEVIAQITTDIYAPMKRQGGFAPRWVNQVLKDTLMPYFVLYIKSEERLHAALTTIMFLKGHVLPLLKAHDAHELRLALECKNMVLCAEIKLRSSLIRKESRGTHYREDYPRRDDAYLAWTKIKQEEGEMKVLLDPIPSRFIAHLDPEYTKRYPLRLPFELDTNKE